VKAVGLLAFFRSLKSTLERKSQQLTVSPSGKNSSVTPAITLYQIWWWIYFFKKESI
jgi:hypothetical protein